MKKRDFLLAGLFLFSASAFAQPGVDEPLRYPDDAKEIYFQGFEGSAKWDTIRLNTDPGRPTTLYTWQAEPVDSITQVTYYKRNYAGGQTDNPSGNTNIYNGEKQWEIAGVRDTLMYLYDGVMRTDEKWPDDSALSFDRQTIEGHDSKSQQGQGAGPNGETGKEYGLDRFGVSGGTQFFRYWSGSSDGMVTTRSGSDGDHYVPDYRRNLFVRNIPIEDSSSYRVTVYVKPTVKANSGVKARIGVDLMRGYFHSEKPFIVDMQGYESTQWVYDGGWKQQKTKSYRTFSDKNDYTALETGKWNKITLMAYYNNDYIGNASPYLLSYYWHDDWDWVTPIDKETGEVVAESADTATLKFIQQPAKYFVRLAFRSDSTEFDVDNLSLTKSWIGGVEYYENMIRVDFGYETNLGELAQKAKEENKIAAVQVPGRYFDVWALWKEGSDTFWENVPIHSAEYQGNGFMYMWTEDWPDEEGGGQRILTEADSVLVTFFNPVDTAALTLRYTGERFPNGLDSAWLADKNNRIVFDFHNEIGSVNPMVPYDTKDLTKSIKSLAELAPVIQQWPEDGSFGFDPETREMNFKFSKNLSYENGKMAESDYAKTKVILKGAGTTEYWDIKDYGDDKSGLTTIVRPSEYTAPLQGDYVLSFEQITHLKNPDLNESDDYADENLKFNYHFGNFDIVTAPSTVVAFSDWRSEIVDYNDNSRAIPTSLYMHNTADPFQKGTGVRGYNNAGTASKAVNGIYSIYDTTMTVAGTVIPDNCLFYLSSRTTSDEVSTGNCYSIQHFDQPGGYTISFKLGGQSSTDRKMALKFYAKPAGELADGNDKGFQILENVSNKTVLVKDKKATVNMGGTFNLNQTKWKDDIETVTYNFSVPAAGDYVFEWVAYGAVSNNYEGLVFSNYWIMTAGDLSYVSVKRINDAIASAETKLAEAGAAKYQSIAFNNLSAVKAAAESFIPTKKAAFDNKPSEYEAEAKVIDDAVNALKLRMDTVDAFFNAYNAALDKFNTYDTAVALQPYKELAAVVSLGVLVNETYAGYDCSFKDPAQIAEDTKALNDAVKAVDDRKALNDNLTEAISNAQAALTSYSSLSAYQVYSDLEDAIIAANVFDAIHCEDDELTSMINAVDEARMALVNRNTLADVATKRIKALDALAKNLNASYGTDEVEAAKIAERIAAIDFDDDDLANIQKAAIKVEMYNKILSSEKVDSTNLTPFIKNYHLYAVVPGIVDRYDVNSVLPGDVTNFKVTANGKLQKVAHRYDDNKAVYILVIDEEYPNSVLPGWTVKSFEYKQPNDNHNMVTPDLRSYENLSAGKFVFDGLLTLDWNSKAELSGAVDMLPAGIYALDVTMKNPTHDNSNSKGTLTATVGGSDYQASLTQTTKGAEGKIKIDSLTITDGNMGIKLAMETNSGGAEADNFNLLYLGADPETDYELAASSARSQLDNLITVVDFTEAEIAEYEYYTLNWIKVETPAKNQIYFRKNGNVVEKVIFK